MCNVWDLDEVQEKCINLLLSAFKSKSKVLELRACFQHQRHSVFSGDQQNNVIGVG